MVTVKAPSKYTRGLWPLVLRSPEEQLALYAQGPDDLEAALAGLSSEDLDQMRVGQWTIRQLIEHIVDDDVRWTMCMQVAVIMPGYTYAHEEFSSTRREPGAGSCDGREQAIAPLVALLRSNRAHVLALLHHLPDAWTRYVGFTRATEQEVQTLTVGQMVWLRTTHVLEHIDDIRLARCLHHREL